MKNCLQIAFILLLASGFLFLAGCPDKPEENKVAQGLVGNWSNELSGDEERTFSIQADGSFSATLNPYKNEGGMGRVEGVLIRDGDAYKMNNMREITNKEWGNAVVLYNGTYVQIKLSENDTVFTLSCANTPAVEQFFGGTYRRQQ